MRRDDGSASSGCSVVMLCLLLLLSHRGRPHAVGPSQPIVATVGDDALLPCHLSPAADAADMRLEWARPDLTPGHVLVWQDGGEAAVDKQPSYAGRTSLSPGGLALGDLSLTLSTVSLSDQGTYRCFAPSQGRPAFITLAVAAVSSPVVQVTEHRGAVVLQCESTGWHPEPEVVWLDGEGTLLSAGPTETIRGPDGLYTVSSRVTVEKRHSSNFTCRVQQKNINQSRETQIHVPVLFWSERCVLALGFFSVVLVAAFTIHGARLRGKKQQVTCLNEEICEEPPQEERQMQQDQGETGAPEETTVRQTEGELTAVSIQLTHR